MMTLSRTLLLLTLTVSASLAEVTYPKTSIFIDDHEFQTEVATTPEQRAHGLMFRTTLADNQAMLFVFERPQRLSFWMKNTKIPLDILYFDNAGYLVEIKRNLPPCKQAACPSYPTQTDNARFAVEVQGGVAEKLNLTTGMKLMGCGFL